MAGGVPFKKGADPRRNLRGRGASVPRRIAELAREDRDATYRALCDLRDNAEDPRVRLEAARTLAAYSDGKPTDAKPEEPSTTPSDEVTEEEAALLRGPGTVTTLYPDKDGQ